MLFGVDLLTEASEQGDGDLDHERDGDLDVLRVFLALLHLAFLDSRTGEGEADLSDSSDSDTCLVRFLLRSSRICKQNYVENFIFHFYQIWCLNVFANFPMI